MGRECEFPVGVSVDVHCAKQNCNPAPISHHQERVSRHCYVPIVLRVPSRFQVKKRPLRRIPTLTRMLG
jgi:hypothetical protein